jgi:uncharacterized protein DUF1064
MKQNANAAWRDIGGKRMYFRSKWEANYARYLEYMKNQGWILEWEHEPKTFWFNGIKRGVVSYLPDFRVLRPNGTHYWVEVKGFMDQRSKTKLARFKRYFPNEEMLLIDKSWFQQNNVSMRILIKEWE